MKLWQISVTAKKKNKVWQKHLETQQNLKNYTATEMWQRRSFVNKQIDGRVVAQLIGICDVILILFAVSGLLVNQSIEMVQL